MAKVKSKALKGTKRQSARLLDPATDEGMAEAWRQTKLMDTSTELASGIGIRSSYIFQLARNLAYCVVHGTNGTNVSPRAMGQMLGHAVGAFAQMGKEAGADDCEEFLRAVVSETYLGGAERTLRTEFAEIEAGFAAGLTQPRVDLTEAIKRAVAAKAERDAEARANRDDAAVRVMSGDGDAKADADDGTEKSRRKTLDLAYEFGDYFHTSDGRAFAVIPVVEDGKKIGRTVCSVNGEQFKRWLGFLHFQNTGDGLSGKRLEELTGALSASAIYEGPERAVFHRVAKHEDAYWIDMGDKAGRAIRLTAEGWEIVKDPPVLFVRPADAKPFVEPLPPGEGDVDDLWQIANVPQAERDSVLAVMLDSFRPETAYPVLFLNAEAGVGKSTTQRAIRALIDPNRNALRSVRKAEDLRAMAAHEHLLSLENVSSLPGELQDMLCSLATGDGGGSQRKLYSDAELHTINVKRPVIINGIPHSITRTDLMSRTIVVQAEQPKHRKTEGELRALEAKLLPSAFGGLLDLFSAALRMLPRIELSQADRSHRLVDYVMLGEAVSRVRGRKAGAFVKAYAMRRQEEALGTLDESTVGSAITRYLEKHDYFTGTVGELFTKLRGIAGDAVDFPRSPKGLRDALNRLKPELLRGGVAAEFGKMLHGARRVTLSLVDDSPLAEKDSEAEERADTYGVASSSDISRGVVAVNFSKGRAAKKGRQAQRYAM